MSKRKYQEISKDDVLPSHLTTSQRRQQQRFQAQLDNAQTQLFRALKLARGFERQKLGRRQKDARGKSSTENSENKEKSVKEIERLEGEVTTLKASRFKLGVYILTLHTNRALTINLPPPTT
jgi:hypothetical protein